MRDLMETPDRAIREDGSIRYGLYRSPFSCLNLTDADIFQKGDSRLRGLGALRLKEWEHFGIFAGPYFLGVALVDLKLAGLSWCCLFNRDSGALHEQERKLLPGKIRIPAELRNGSLDLKAGEGTASCWRTVFRRGITVSSFR